MMLFRDSAATERYCSQPCRSDSVLWLAASVPWSKWDSSKSTRNWWSGANLWACRSWKKRQECGTVHSITVTATLTDRMLAGVLRVRKVTLCSLIKCWAYTCTARRSWWAMNAISKQSATLIIFTTPATSKLSELGVYASGSSSCVCSGKQWLPIGA